MLEELEKVEEMQFIIAILLALQLGMLQLARLKAGLIIVFLAQMENNRQKQNCG
jgi:hypothetical protein